MDCQPFYTRVKQNTPCAYFLIVYIIIIAEKSID